MSTPAPVAASCALAASDQGFASDACPVEEAPEDDELDEAVPEDDGPDADALEEDAEEEADPPEQAASAMKDAKQMHMSSTIGFLFIVLPSLPLNIIATSQGFLLPKATSSSQRGKGQWV